MRVKNGYENQGSKTGLGRVQRPFFQRARGQLEVRDNESALRVL